MQHQLRVSAGEVNPHAGEGAQLQQLIHSAQQELEAAEKGQAALEHEVAWRGIVDKAFGRGGIQSFALEGILQELQVWTVLPLQHTTT